MKNYTLSDWKLGQLAEMRPQIVATDAIVIIACVVVLCFLSFVI